MAKFSKVFWGVAILAAVVGVGVFIGWLGSRGALPTPRLPPVNLPTAESRPIVQQPPVATASTPPRSTPGNASAANPSPAVVVTTPGLITNWDDRVDQILAADTDDTNKVAQLFDIFPRLPEDGQVEVAEHLSNLVPDDNYTRLGQLLEDPKLPESVLDELMADALNRPNSVKLPVLLQVAQEPDNPKASEAKDLLELYLDEDYGTDWSQWQTKLQAWLKDNPD